MFPVLSMGIDVELVESVGPVVERPLASAADVDALRVTDPEESVASILEAVRGILRQEPHDDAHSVHTPRSRWKLFTFLSYAGPLLATITTCSYAGAAGRPRSALPRTATGCRPCRTPVTRFQPTTADPR